MKTIIIALLVAFNIVAAFNGYSPYLVTIAELPVRDVPLGDQSPETIASLLGHERHTASEGMRDFLAPSVRWLLGAVLLNLTTAIVALIRTPIALGTRRDNKPIASNDATNVAIRANNRLRL